MYIHTPPWHLLLGHTNCLKVKEELDRLKCLEVYNTHKETITQINKFNEKFPNSKFLWNVYIQSLQLNKKHILSFAGDDFIFKENYFIPLHPRQIFQKLDTVSFHPNGEQTAQPLECTIKNNAIIFISTSSCINIENEAYR